jgi:hypothetical protein
MSVDHQSEVPLCQRISSLIAQITFGQSAIGGLFGDVSETNYLHSQGDPIEEARRVPLYHASSVENHFIGLVGFEPTACRRGDRSTAAYRAHLCLAQSCSIVRAVLLLSESESFRCGSGPTVLRVWLPWTPQHYGGEYAHLDRRKNPHSVVRS